jgi:hypothetical protein
MGVTGSGACLVEVVVEMGTIVVDEVGAAARSDGVTTPQDASSRPRATPPDTHRDDEPTGHGHRGEKGWRGTGPACHDVAGASHRPAHARWPVIATTYARPMAGRVRQATEPAGSALEAGLDLGSPGASAEAEFIRRRASDDRRRRALFGRHLARLVKLVVGERQATTAWRRGAEGEVRVAIHLGQATAGLGVVLHDRAVPGTRANIDHIAVVPSGVWVIDTKRYTGRVQRRDLGGWFSVHPALFVNGRDRSAMLTGVLGQAGRVARIDLGGAPVHPALCFVDAEWGLTGRPFLIDGVRIASATRLGRALREPGPLDPVAVSALAAKIARHFPAYRALPLPPDHRPGADPPRRGGASRMPR